MKLSKPDRFLEAMNSFPAVITWLVGTAGMVVLFAYLAMPFQAAVWLLCALMWAFNLGGLIERRQKQAQIDTLFLLLDRYREAFHTEVLRDAAPPETDASGGIPD